MSHLHKTFVTWSSISNFWRHSRNLFLDERLSHPGVCTKEFISCGFTFFSSCSFSFADSSHHLVTAPLILTWFAEWIVRNKSSVRWIRIEVYGISATFSFQNSTTQSTDALEYWVYSFFQMSYQLCGNGIPIFLQVCSWEFRTASFSSPGPGNVQCPVQSMSLNIDMKMIRSSKCPGSLFWFCKSFGVFWRFSSKVSPGNIFHSNSIGSPSIQKKISIWIWLSNFFKMIIPSFVRSWMFLHLLQAIDGIWVDVCFWFRPLDYLIMRKRRSRP